MNFVVLSQRAKAPVIGWQPIYEFEDLLVRITDGQLLAPFRTHPRRSLKWGRVHRMIGASPSVELSLDRTRGPSVLLVVVDSPTAIGAISAIRNWRNRFDIVAAFVVDSFQPWPHSNAFDRIDHFFMPVPEDAERQSGRLRATVTFLPFAADVLNFGSAQPHRPIDLVAYGRKSIELHQALQQSFNRPTSDHIYMHSPFGLDDYGEWRAGRLLFWKILQKSSIALAFDNAVSGKRVKALPLSFLTPRWFECLAAGCVTAGKRCSSPTSARLLHWADAVIDLSDDPGQAVASIEELLADSTRLAEIRQRNFLNCAQRHDWRHRIVKIFDGLTLAIPEKLKAEISQLDRIVRESGGAEPETVTA